MEIFQRLKRMLEYLALQVGDLHLDLEKSHDIVKFVMAHLKRFSRCQVFRLDPALSAAAEISQDGDAKRRVRSRRLHGKGGILQCPERWLRWHSVSPDVELEMFHRESMSVHHSQQANSHESQVAAWRPHRPRAKPQAAIISSP